MIGIYNGLVVHFVACGRNRTIFSMHHIFCLVSHELVTKMTDYYCLAKSFLLVDYMFSSSYIDETFILDMLFI